MVFEANAAVTPAGNPVAVPIPCSSCCMGISVNTVLIHNVGVDVMQFLLYWVGVTVTVLVAEASTQPPVPVTGIMVAVFRGNSCTNSLLKN
jgi:hypothetical protein